METFYSSGIRCGELVALDVYDINFEREVLTVRCGKGNKDRVVPIGTRADMDQKMGTRHSSESCHRIISPVVVRFKKRKTPRPQLRVKPDKKYLNAININYRGSCHLLRHTAATLMMETGADLRSLQQFLGHARLNTTQIYTHVSIKRLQEVHRKTHPAKPDGKPTDDQSTA